MDNKYAKDTHGHHGGEQSHGHEHKDEHGCHDHGEQGSHNHDSHGNSIYGEVVCHLPYAIFASAFALAILSFISVGHTDVDRLCVTAHGLFHSFHFMHIVFAATGTA